MSQRARRFKKRYGVVADAIARLDLDQDDREAVARAVGDAFDTRDADYDRDLFVLLASDPLVPCAGPGDGVPCPDGREIRVAMHDPDMVSGRSAAWRRRPPVVRCVACGMARYRRSFENGPLEEVPR